MNPKILSLLLLSFVWSCALAQGVLTIEGKVTDKSTSEPIPYANIRLSGSQFGTVTSGSGNFVFRFSAAGRDNVVVVSHVGYKPVEINVGDTVSTFFAIALEPQPYQLDELVVRPLSGLDVVYNCVVNLSQNYNASPHSVRGFQREFVKHHGKFIQVLEVSFETKQGAGGSGISNVLDARFIEDKAEKAPLWNPSRGGFYTLGWTSVSGIETPSARDFLGIDVSEKRDLDKYYDFEAPQWVTYDGQEVCVINFDQKKGTRGALLKGVLYIDPDNYAIIRMVWELSPHGLKNLPPHETVGGRKISSPPKRLVVRMEKYEVNFRKYGNRWYLNSLVTDTYFDASLVLFGIVQAEKKSLHLHSERVVTGIDTTAAPDVNDQSNISDVGSIPSLQNFVKKNYEHYDSADGERWSDINFIRSDTSFSKIARALALSNGEWEEFQKKRNLEKRIARTQYSRKQLAVDLDYLEETLKAVHPALYWYSREEVIDNRFRGTKRKLKRRNTEDHFFHLVSRLVESVHCGHTNATPSLSKAEYLKVHAKQLPLELWIKGDSAFVKRSSAGIDEGSAVIDINGIAMRDIITLIRNSTPSDGYNLTYKDYLLNRGFPALFSEYFPPTDTFEVTTINRTGARNTVHVAGEKKSLVQAPDARYATFVVYESSKTALLKIPSFFTDQDLPLFLHETFENIKSTGVKRLIIDVRNNEGGRDEYGSLLFSYLAKEPFSYYKNLRVATADTVYLNRLAFGELPFSAVIPRYIQGIQSKDDTLYFVNHSNLAVQQPKENAFHGEVYVLINGGTFSSAAEFASITYDQKRAIFVGEEAGGGFRGNSSLGTPALTLPNSKVRITIPLAWHALAVGDGIPVGHGVIPHYRVIYSLADILGKRDKELEFCLDRIADQQR